MAKKLDEATKLLVDSLPENLKELALSATEPGYLSQMDFDAAIQADEVPEEEQAEVLDFFKAYEVASWQEVSRIMVSLPVSVRICVSTVFRFSKDPCQKG